MTIDEAIKQQMDFAKMNEYNSKSCKDSYSKECYQKYSADHRQLAEWLTDYKELKNSIGAVKLSDIKEALELIRDYKADNIEQKKLIAEYKRLLKSAIDEWHIVCEWGDCSERCDWFENGKCTQEWRYKAEALKLIGDESNEV